MTKTKERKGKIEKIENLENLVKEFMVLTNWDYLNSSDNMDNRLNIKPLFSKMLFIILKLGVLF